MQDDKYQESSDGEQFEQYSQLGDDLIWTNEEKAKSGLETLLRYPSIHAARKVEWSNVIFCYEVAKKYTLLCPETSAVLGHVEEEQNGWLGWMARQVRSEWGTGGPKAHKLLVWLYSSMSESREYSCVYVSQVLRGRRGFSALVTNASGEPLLRIRRPPYLFTSWLQIGSPLGLPVGHVVQNFSLFYRHYDVFFEDGAGTRTHSSSYGRDEHKSSVCSASEVMSQSPGDGKSQADLSIRGGFLSWDFNVRKALVPSSPHSDAEATDYLLEVPMPELAKISRQLQVCAR